MARSYKHIKEYETEILELKAKSLAKQEIGERLGLRFKQILLNLKKFGLSEEQHITLLEYSDFSFEM